MKKVIEKTRMCQYNVETAKEIKKFLTEKYMCGDYGETKETIHNFISLLEKFINELKFEDVDMEKKVKESEEEAREYFGKDFIENFEKIRQFCYDNNLSYAIHGTNPEILETIQKEGLIYKNPAILSTALIQNGIDIEENYTDYSKLLNWPHREYKGLVVLGIPKECNGILLNGEKETKPLWLKTSKDGAYESQYKIKPEFIIGQIDVDKKTIQRNPSFSLKHDYSGLEYDNDLTDYGRRISIIGAVRKNKTVEQQENDDVKNEESVASEESQIESEKDLLNNVKINLMPHIYNLIRGAGKKEEEVFQEYLDSIKQTITILESVKPQLKANQDIRKELETLDEETEDNSERDDFKRDDDFEWDDGFKGEDDFEQGSFIEDIEDSIAQNATITGINQETQYIKSKIIGKSEKEEKITRDDEVN